MYRIATIAVLLSLAACSGGSDPAAEEDGDAPMAAESDPAAEPVVLNAVPEPFHGRWDFSEDTCADPASEMRLDIAADLITYYESAAIPMTVTETEPGALTVVHSFSGEGEEWEETLAYELSEDGDRLTVHSPDGSMSIRMRCPN
ncbi:hypothetical protein [Parasphingopyxis sp.]|uniref:hypothetical protein n=1 Tax=Parasphingopyxis sp. TaxID=1920299 RepID=UPI002626BA2D|nr:hypothetical protein [Parasphingopyxis sp.]